MSLKSELNQEFYYMHGDVDKVALGNRRQQRQKTSKITHIFVVFEVQRTLPNLTCLVEVLVFLLNDQSSNSQ